MQFGHPPVGGPYTGEVCAACGLSATHKVAEETSEPRHPFTAYVCCVHFGALMGVVAQRWCMQADRNRQGG